MRGGIEREDQMMNPGKDRTAGASGADHQDPYGLYKPHTKFIVDDLVRLFNEGKVVYCRFGKQYIQNLERQMNSLLNSNTQV